MCLITIIDCKMEDQLSERGGFFTLSDFNYLEQNHTCTCSKLETFGSIPVYLRFGNWIYLLPNSKQSSSLPLSL